MNKKYFVYIVINEKNTVLYIGITSDLPGRIYKHKVKYYGRRSFTGRYNVDKLVYYEEFSSPQEAIAREKQLKGWVRRKKLALIKGFNPQLRDLYEGL